MRFGQCIGLGLRSGAPTFPAATINGGATAEGRRRRLASEPGRSKAQSLRAAKMAKHHRIPTLAENINRSPRLSYLASHSQSASFMSEGGEITELMALDESENLLHDRTASVQVISGSGGALCGSYGSSYASGTLAGPLTPGGRMLVGGNVVAAATAINGGGGVNAGGISPGVGSYGEGSERLEELGIPFNEQLMYGAVGGKLLTGSPTVTILEMAGGGGHAALRQKNFKRKSTATAAMVASGEQTSLNAIGKCAIGAGGRSVPVSVC